MATVQDLRDRHAAWHVIGPAIQRLRVLEMRNPKKFEMAKELGATDCVNPKDYDKPIQQATRLPLSRVYGR